MQHASSHFLTDRTSFWLGDEGKVPSSSKHLLASILDRCTQQQTCPGVRVSDKQMKSEFGGKKKKTHGSQEQAQRAGPFCSLGPTFSPPSGILTCRHDGRWHSSHLHLTTKERLGGTDKDLKAWYPWVSVLHLPCSVLVVSWKKIKPLSNSSHCHLGVSPTHSQMQSLFEERVIKLHLCSRVTSACSYLFHSTQPRTSGLQATVKSKLLPKGKGGSTYRHAYYSCLCLGGWALRRCV